MPGRHGIRIDKLNSPLTIGDLSLIENYLDGFKENKKLQHRIWDQLALFVRETIKHLDAQPSPDFKKEREQLHRVIAKLEERLY